MRHLTRSRTPLQTSFFRTRRRLQASAEFLVPIPEGEASPTFYAPRKCKVWGVRGQNVNGPGGMLPAYLTLQDDGANVISTFEFDTVASTPTPKGVIDAAHQDLDEGDPIYISKEDVDQSGWILIRLAFDDQVGPT
jgi:hypothetical protein